jgi:periplasmic divalent cation tolerance protein
MDQELPTGGQDYSSPPVFSGLMIVLCTFPDESTARRICREIISEHFAACANLIPKVESIYRWEGKVEQENEALAIFKVAAASYAKLEQALLEKHPYDTPEIVGLPAEKVEKSYLAWALKES